MTDYRILIVDDQHEVRRMLTSGVKTLGASFDVVDVPSGEEALLEASRRPVDLLVTDVRLPGFSGFDLVTKIKKRNPSLKFILVTGVNDSKIRRQVAEAGADAFFYKPIEMADFLDAVERSLGLVQTIFPTAPIIDEPVEVEKSPTLADRLSELRMELDAISVAVVDDQGKVYAQAGDLPEVATEAEWIPAILNTLAVGANLSHILGYKEPQGLFRLSGVVYSLCAAYIGKSHALLTVTAEVLPAQKLTLLDRYLTLITEELEHELADIREAHFVEGMETLDVTSITEEELLESVEISAEELPAIDALFQKATKLGTDELDAFWDQLAEQADSDSILNADTLTYEQARKLGLAPENDTEKS